ncbi:MAG: DsbA family protein, partial [Candidatus Marsarchaeota archaeon]|nr:DsbA family protein [Candidatus Marsarchaeota archaeon]
GDQGKFWEYYDSLFTTQKLEVSDLKAQAKSLGLDTAKFNTCLDSGAKASLIEAFTNLVAQNGVSSTPTFIVNGQPLDDNSLAGFSKRIDAILNPPRAVINTTGRPMRGNASAPLQIVEFSDFECPYCEVEYGVLRQVEKDYAGKVGFTYMNYPLTTIHPNAQKAAEAAECAYRQKPAAFWQFHDWIFENRTLDVPSLKAYAASTGLNATRFNACLDGGEAAAQVAADAAQGSANGVSGTPAVFVNGLAIPGGAQPYEVVKTYLDKELALVAKNAANASAGAS